MSLQKRVERLEARAPAAGERLLSTEEMAELLAGLVGEIASDPERRRSFLDLVDGAQVTTAEIVDLYFEPEPGAQSEADVIYVWLWLAAFNGEPYETIEAWVGVDNFYNLTRYQASVLRQRLPKKA